MATLYKLNAAYLELLEMMEDPDKDPAEIEAYLSELDGSIQDKIYGYFVIIKELEANTQKVENELERLTKWKSSLSKNTDRMKDAVVQAMKITGHQKVETDLVTATLRKGNPSLVIDIEEDIPEEYYKPQPPKLDKRALLAYVKEQEADGDELEWAHTETKDVLIMK